MHEVFPVVAGIVVGLLAMRLPAGRPRGIAVAALSVVFGVLASAISGELELSAGFILIDIPQVLVTAALTATLVTAWQRRAVRVRR